MRRLSKREDLCIRTVGFGLVPCVLGLGTMLYLRSVGSVWLTTGGSFWPIATSCLSVIIAIKLMFSRIADGTTAIAAWLILGFTWFYTPMWMTAIEVPRSTAVVEQDGTVHVVGDVSRYAEFQVWLLNHTARNRLVKNVIGKVSAGELALDYRFADTYIATRRDHDDLYAAIAPAAEAAMREQAGHTRAERIALLDDTGVRDRVLQSICSAAGVERLPCPIKMKLTPDNESTVLGSTWSKLYTETEAVEARHLPTLMRLLTQFDSALVHRDEVFATFLQLAVAVEPLSNVAQRPYWLSDQQFDEVVRRVLASPGCGTEAVMMIAKANRLKPEQRQALRARALDEAAIATLVEHATALRISDAELMHLTARMRAGFATDPNAAVRALEIFGERLSRESQRDAVTAITKAKSSYSLAALRHVNFSAELRQELIKKVLSDADYTDFSTARLSKESLQGILSPAELRPLIAMSVKRSETSEAWLDFAVNSIAVREMMPKERSAVLNGLMFKSPKAALEFASENRRYLDAAEVDEVTRDYSRTITADFCLHLSHRNNNRGIAYFSESQLQMFRDCARSK